MAIVSGENCQYLCRGCEEPWPNYSRAIGHRRLKEYKDCKGAGIDVIVPDDSLPLESSPVAVLAAGETPAVEQPEEPEKRQEKLGDEDQETAGDEGLKVQDGGGSRNGQRSNMRSVGPSTTKETILVPVTFRSIYDMVRAYYRYDGTFNEFACQAIEGYCVRVLGIKPAVIIGDIPQYQQDPQDQQVANGEITQRH